MLGVKKEIISNSTFHFHNIGSNCMVETSLWECSSRSASLSETFSVLYGTLKFSYRDHFRCV